MKGSEKIFMSFKTLIIIPAYNEENVVHLVINKIKNLNQGYEIVVINDGSKDNTAKVAQEAGAIVINLPHNLGIGGAMQTGYLYAFKNGYDIAVQIDADGQHNPEELSRLLEPILDGKANLVVGSRYVEKTNYRTTLMRRLGMVIFSSVVTIITGQKFTDTTSGYRAADRRIIAYYADYYPVDYPEVEALVILKKAGCCIKEISVGMNARKAGKSSITPFKSIYYMVKVLLVLFVNILRPGIKGEFTHGL
jgi:glycosyltransferase involved in cell wall biosynthesis